MKNEITIKLTAAQVEIVSQVLTVVKDVMKLDEEHGEYIADYESFILSLNNDELTALQVVIRFQNCIFDISETPEVRLCIAALRCDSLSKLYL